MNNYLLAGSYAYDTILLHNGEFHAKILPESIARLNVAFNMDSVRDEFGGTAGNIAFNATLFEQYPVLIGCLGKDGLKYDKRMKKLGLQPITLTYHMQESTPHAWLMTDTINNQIIAFNGGAMKHRPNLPQETPNLWHLAADNPITTAWLAKTAIALNKQYFFDPGQALPYFTNDSTEDSFSLLEIIKNATGIFVNDYEAELLSEKLGVKLEEIIKSDSQFLIKTLGAKGVELFTLGNKQHFGVAKTNKIVDPTGCGDAFRAGFLYGFTNNMTLNKCVELGSTMGSFAIEYSGGQNHKPTIVEIFNRQNDSFQNTIESKAMKII
jgi:adenosine kinase